MCVCVCIYMCVCVCVCVCVFYYLSLLYKPNSRMFCFHCNTGIVEGEQPNIFIEGDNKNDLLWRLEYVKI